MLQITQIIQSAQVVDSLVPCGGGGATGLGGTGGATDVELGH